MQIGSIHALLLFMIFIMRYISKFLPKAEEEPDNEENVSPETQPTSRYLPLF